MQTSANLRGLVSSAAVYITVPNISWQGRYYTATDVWKTGMEHDTDPMCILKTQWYTEFYNLFSHCNSFHLEKLHLRKYKTLTCYNHFQLNMVKYSSIKNEHGMTPR